MLTILIRIADNDMKRKHIKWESTVHRVFQDSRSCCSVITRARCRSNARKSFSARRWKTPTISGSARDW